MDNSTSLPTPATSLGIDNNTLAAIAATFFLAAEHMQTHPQSVTSEADMVGAPITGTRSYEYRL